MTRRAGAIKGALLLLVPAAFAAGCGGGSGSPAEHDMSFGRLVTRIVGAAQEPVTASSLGATVTGIAGASFTSLIVNNPSPGLSTTQIAFVAGNDIDLLGFNGTAVKNVTNNPAFDIRPAWSPDSTKIAFLSARDGNDEIYVMNLNGSSQTRLINNSALDGDPSWSPDGKKIAFHSNRDGILDIYSMAASGGPATRLAFALNATAPEKCGSMRERAG